MPFISYRAQLKSKKCEDCRFNFVKNYKIDEKGYAHFMELDNKLAQLKFGMMWASCKVCPNREDFKKIYGIEPVDYYSAALS